MSHHPALWICALVGWLVGVEVVFWRINARRTRRAIEEIRREGEELRRWLAADAEARRRASEKS